MNFVDKLEIAGTRRRAEDGALIVDARVARTGIQFYAGHEVGKPEIPVVRVYRDAKQVFDMEARASFAHRPVTNDHPPEPVTADNWKKYAVGGSGDQVARDGDFIRVPLMISDGATIADIESGKRELSAGYRCDLDWTPGMTADGSPFDCSQTNIRANHIAVCDSARGGSKLRIGDGWGSAPIRLDNISTGVPKMATKMIQLADGAAFGLPIEVTDAAETVIRRLEKSLSDSAAALSLANTTHAAAIAAKDTQIGALTAELAAIKDKAPKPADIQAMVIDRANLFGKAAAIIKDFKPETFADKDNDAVRAACVASVMGDEAIKNRSAAEISGMFAVIAKDAKPAASGVDPFRMAVQDGTPPAAPKQAYKDYVANLTKAA